MASPWALLLLLLLLLPAPSLTLQQANQQDYIVHKGPLGLILSSASNQIIAFWDSVVGTEYNLAWECDDGTEDSVIVTAKEDFSQYSIELLPCTGCDVTVQAWDGGPQGESDTQSSRTKGIDPSIVPSVTVTPDPCNPWLAVSWLEAQAGNCFILYTVSWRTTEDSSPIGQTNTSDTSLNITAGLEHGTKYEVCVVAQTDGDPTGKTCFIAALTPPPSGGAMNLKLSPGSYSIYVFWSSVKDTDYNITWVCDDKDGTEGSVIVTATDDSSSHKFDVTFCTNCNVTLQRWVEGPVCEPATESTRTKGVDPGPVDTVSVTTQSSSCDPWLSANWSPVQFGNCSVQYNVIWLDIDSYNFVNKTTTSEPTLDITTGLQLETRYSVCVSVTAEGPESQKICEGTKTPTSGDILSLTLTPDTSAILASWKNSAPGVYNLSWECGQTTGSSIVPQTPNETVHHRIKLPPCAHCNVTVEAGGDGEQCQSYMESSRAGAQVPEPVAEVNVTSADCSASLDVSWTPVEVGSCLLHYLVSWRVSGSDEVLGNNSTLDTTLTIDSGLAFGTNYSVSVAAEGEDGGPSQDVCSVASTPTSTGGPLGLVLSATPYEIVACWAAASETVSNITWVCDGTTGSNVTSGASSGNTVHYAIELLPCTACDISVHQDGTLDGGSSTTKGVAPAPPTDLTTTPQTDSILVEWKEVHTPNCDITHYSVSWAQMNESGGGNTESCQYTITDLAPDITTTITVRAVNSFGYSEGVTITDVIEAGNNNNDDDPPSELNVAAIVGGVLGGLLVLGIAGAVFCKRDKIFSKAKRSPSKTLTPTL